MLNKALSKKEFSTILRLLNTEDRVWENRDADFRKERFANLFYGRRSVRNKQDWGWKEPNSHIFLESLCKHFSRLRYIHVIRHGLDMAFSENQQQLHNWGKTHFDIPTPGNRDLLPQTSLEYWIRANQRAIDVGRQHLGERFFLLNFDDLCSDPATVIRALLKFINRDTSLCEKMINAVTVPPSIGRYKKRDLSVFTERQFRQVEELGFKIDRQKEPMAIEEDERCLVC